MEQMVQDNIKKIKEKLKEKLSGLKQPLGKMIVAMIMILIVIAILLIQGVTSKSVNDTSDAINLDVENVFVESMDNRLNVFVKGYFKARTYLDFVNIYRAFDKDYLLIKDTEEGKKYDNGIMYEKNYVKDFSNIKVYEYAGLIDNERVVLITYDMNFYFSDALVPSMIVGYVKDDGKKLYFKENLDIGESKYISNLMESSMVKTMYSDIKNRLEMLVTNDSKLKLAYNSLRQYDMNPNNNMMDDKDMLVEKIFGTEKVKEEELINLARKKEGLDNEEK